MDVTGGVLTGSTTLNGCGTTVSVTDDSLVFSNAVFLHFADNVTNVDRVIPLQCRYPRVTDVRLSYLPVVRRVLFTERGVGRFDFRIRQFQDSSFSSGVADAAYPLRTQPAQDVFVQLSLGGGGDQDLDQSHLGGAGDYGMEVEGCIASPSSSSFMAEGSGVYKALVEDGWAFI